MAVRSSMAYLNLVIRRLINDPSGAAQQFSDEEIQETLDERRLVTNYEMLRGERSIQNGTGGPTVIYLNYYAQFGWWEGDTRLVDRSWQDIPASPAVNAEGFSLASSNLEVGHWVMASNVWPPVFLVGKSYDPYGSAADMLEKYAMRMALLYDFQTQGRKYTRSQMHKMLADQAALYRQRQRPVTMIQFRDDLATRDDSGVPGNYPSGW